MKERSNSQEHITSAPDVRFSRALSCESSFDNQHNRRKRKQSTSHAVAPFCRQSTICSNTSINNVQNVVDEEKKSGKLINNTRELLILIGMALIEFTGTSAMSVIAPFFAPEVNCLLL